MAPPTRRAAFEESNNFAEQQRSASSAETSGNDSHPRSRNTGGGRLGVSSSTGDGYGMGLSAAGIMGQLRPHFGSLARVNTGTLPLPRHQEAMGISTGMSSAYLFNNNRRGMGSDVRDRILQRLNDIAREEQEIERARALLIGRQQRQHLEGAQGGAARNLDGSTSVAAGIVSDQQTALAGGGRVGEAHQSRLLPALEEDKQPHSDTQTSGQKITTEGSTVSGASVRDHDPAVRLDTQTSRVHEEASIQADKQEKTDGIAKKGKETFPLKLYRLLEEAERDGHEDIISWVPPHALSFTVHKPKEFVADIMPKYFAGGKMNTFQKQLNLYCFKRKATGPDKGAYFHKDFVKGKPSLCKRIKRQNTTQSTSQKTTTSSTASSAGRIPQSGEANSQQRDMHYSSTSPPCSQSDVEIGRIRTTTLPGFGRDSYSLDRLTEAISTEGRRYREQQFTQNDSHALNLTKSSPSSSSNTEEAKPAATGK